ncbi:MAG: hypothetical protein KDA89_14140 [Planctomycetaceae bacterium]|nr:hypothetical protein [Planctomycetaceae bacterium]MCA9049870.1 hypothetical protein [Planctomycetaceae bacterium]
MPSPANTKASDKQQAVKKLTTLLQKDYGKSVPRLKLPVVETMLFAACLEDNAWDSAQAAYDKLLRSYFDLNEVRVSSVGELEQTLRELKGAEWKGLRIRAILRFVFESTYSFDFEKLTKLNLESAQKKLRKIEYISPFLMNFTLQQCLGMHVVCLDDSMTAAAKHLGIVPPDADVDAASEFLKAGVRKTDAFGFAHLLKCLSVDPKYTARLAEPVEHDEFDVLKVSDRLQELKSPKPKKAAAKKTPAASKTTAEGDRKKSSTTTKSAAPKKPAVKTPAGKKSPSKSAPKKTGSKTASKSGASKSPKKKK